MLPDVSTPRPSPAAREATWIRRVGTLSGVTLAFLAVLGSLPILLPLAALYDVMRGTRFTAVRVVLFAAVFLTCELVGVAAAAILFLHEWVARPAEHGRANEADDRFHALERRWALAIFRGAQTVFGFRVEIEPGSDTGLGPIIAFVRHASIADTLLPVVLLAPRGLRFRYVLKHELRFDPCLDLVGHRLPNTFVRRSSGDAEREIGEIARLADGLGPRDAVVIYPEGTRFTEAKRERVLAKLDASGDLEAAARARRLSNVLPPHLGGPLGLLERNTGADVVFLAHAGFEGIATFWDLWAGALVGATIRVALWRVPFADIPKDREDRIAWLHAHWRLVDDWVGAQRARGRA
jgi:1-acyl-sn-glycerol-3-phosphate acyltransferase